MELYEKIVPLANALKVLSKEYLQISDFVKSISKLFGGVTEGVSFIDKKIFDCLTHPVEAKEKVAKERIKEYIGYLLAEEEIPYTERISEKHGGIKIRHIAEEMHSSILTSLEEELRFRREGISKVKTCVEACKTASDHYKGHKKKDLSKISSQIITNETILDNLNKDLGNYESLENNLNSAADAIMEILKGNNIPLEYLKGVFNSFYDLEPKIKKDLGIKDFTSGHFKVFFYDGGMGYRYKIADGQPKKLDETVINIFDEFYTDRIIRCPSTNVDCNKVNPLFEYAKSIYESIPKEQRDYGKLTIAGRKTNNEFVLISTAKGVYRKENPDIDLFLVNIKCFQDEKGFKESLEDELKKCDKSSRDFHEIHNSSFPSYLIIHRDIKNMVDEINIRKTAFEMMNN